MKYLLFLFVFAPVSLIAQNNYFVNEGNLEVMRAIDDEGYVGVGDDGKSVVKLNHDFELEWAVGEFKGAVLDIVVNQETGVIAVVHKHYELCEVTQINSDGTVLDRQGISFEGNFTDVDIELTSDGYAFGFNAFKDLAATQPSAIIGVTDEELNFEWLKSFETPEGYELKEIDLEVYDDSIAFLTTSLWNDPDAWDDLNYSSLSRFTVAGDLVGVTLLGTQCSQYVDIEPLHAGGFVVVGEVIKDEAEAIKISVLNHAGKVIATKQRSTSWSDSGWNRATVEVLSDDRYVVCNNYYEGHGSYNQGVFYLFDNHKAVQVWQFRPTPWVGEDNDGLDLWCIDQNDQLIFTGDVYDNEYGVYSNFTMGRMTWLSESCGIGDYYDTWLNYGIDPTDSIEIDLEALAPLALVEILDPLVPWEYSNIFDCSNDSFDDGSIIEDDHLYGGDIVDCFTIEEEDDDDPEDEGEGDDDDNIDDGGEGEIDDVGLNEENQEELLVFPNPSNGNFTIQANEVVEIRIFTTAGKEVERFYPTSDRVVVNEFNRTGVFIIQILNENGIWQTAKLVVQ